MKNTGKPDPIDPFKNDPFWPMTRLTRQLDWPEPTHPARFVMSTDDAEKVTSEPHDTCTLEIAPA